MDFALKCCLSILILFQRYGWITLFNIAFGLRGCSKNLRTDIENVIRTCYSNRGSEASLGWRGGRLSSHTQAMAQ